MIDFNSRSEITNRINYFIDEGIAKRESTSPRRKYLGASVVGHPCIRHVQYHLLSAWGGPVKRTTIEPRILRIFDRGHVYEDKCRDWLIGAGFRFDGNPRFHSFSDFDGHFKGHCDGIIDRWKPSIPCPIKLPALWEHKCLGSKSWKKLEDDKLQAYSSTYWAQVHIYMHYLGFTECLFSATNADTMEVYHEVVEYNPTEATLLVSKVATVIQKSIESVMLPRLSDDPAYYVCKMCQWYEGCHARL